jgi:predicted ATPase
MLRRFILTGGPGAGKTALLRRLETRGHAVVEEAATDVIALEQARGVAEPWLRPGFVEAITELQRIRRLGRLAGAEWADRATSGAHPHGVQGANRAQVHDRSAVCTLALARFLGVPVPPILASELELIAAQPVYAPTVLFVRMLGFVTRTEARRIGLEDALRFEGVHEQAYREYGFELVDVPAAPVDERAEAVSALLREWTAGPARPRAQALTEPGS